MKKKITRRESPKISAGSMADIAFLLLIFFLVTTTIVEDKGILVRLPQWTDEPITAQINERNVLSILINGEDQILVEDRITSISDLKNGIINFIKNPFGRNDLPASPDKAIISIINHRDTDYDTYVIVYDEIQGAYRDIWEEESQRLYQTPFQKLRLDKKKEIRKIYPQIISEAEPFGK